jgi:hypothetical protein
MDLTLSRLMLPGRLVGIEITKNDLSAQPKGGASAKA